MCSGLGIALRAMGRFVDVMAGYYCIASDVNLSMKITQSVRALPT